MELNKWCIKDNKDTGKCHMVYRVSKNTRFEIMVGQDDKRNPVYSVVRIALKRKRNSRRVEIGKFGFLEDAIECALDAAKKYVPTDYGAIAARRNTLYDYMRDYCDYAGTVEEN